MELIQRYVDTVRFFLPLERKEDIGRELQANLREHAADREAELGRTLTRQEEAELVQAFGHPYLVAMKYRPQQTLIGPLVYPAYWLAVKVAMAITFVVYAFGVGALVVAGRPAGEVAGSLFGFFHGALPAFGWVTLLFAGVEWILRRFQVVQKWEHKWDPETTLKPLKKVKTPNPWEPMLDIVLGVLFGAWFIASFEHPQMVFGLLPVALDYGPVWRELFGVWVAVIVCSVAADLLKLLRPRRDWTMFAARAVPKLTGAWLCYVVARSGSAVVVADRAASESALAMGSIINLCIVASLGIAAVTTVVVLIAETVVYARETSTRA